MKRLWDNWTGVDGETSVMGLLYLYMIIIAVASTAFHSNVKIYTTTDVFRGKNSPLKRKMPRMFPKFCHQQVFPTDKSIFSCSHGRLTTRLNKKNKETGQLFRNATFLQQNVTNDIQMIVPWGCILYMFPFFNYLSCWEKKNSQDWNSCWGKRGYRYPIKQ